MSLALILNETYLDAKGNRVKIIEILPTTSPDYEQGFRYRGDNGYLYTTHGLVTGGVGIATIIQAGAEPLTVLVSDSLDTAVAEMVEGIVAACSLRVGAYYRNGIGAIIQIVAEVDPSTNRFKSGYRYIDHRGTYYTQTGSVKSWLFKSLDLQAEVSADTVTADTIEVVEQQVVEAVKVTEAAATSDKAARATVGAIIGLGVVQAAVFATTGRFIS